MAPLKFLIVLRIITKGNIKCNGWEYNKSVEVIILDRLKELRQEKNINQLKLAMDLNITQASVSKYEIGAREPSLEILEKMSDYFGVSTDYLIGRSDIRKPLTAKELKKDELDLIYKYRNLKESDKHRLQGYMDCLGGK